MSDMVRPTDIGSPAVTLPSRMSRLPIRRAVPEAVPEHVSVHRPSSPMVNWAGADEDPSPVFDAAEPVIAPVHAPANGRKSSRCWAALLTVANADSTANNPITTPSRLTPAPPQWGAPTWPP